MSVVLKWKYNVLNIKQVCAYVLVFCYNVIGDKNESNNRN